MRARLAALVLCGVLSGCSTFGGLYDTPLPGGADLGDNPYRVTVNFTDVLDLVPQSGVRVNDIAVGRVDKISLADDGASARVELLVNGDVELPANAVARLRQSSVLGEKFVELASPPGVVPQGKLTDGTVIDLPRTNRNAEIEEVLGALSLLLNGGGIAQLEEINSELTAALDGNTASVRSLLRNLETFTGSFAKNRKQLIRAIDASDRLAKTLAGRSDKIAGAIDDLEPGIAVLAEQQGALRKMLRSLDDLSDVAVDTVNRSKDDVVADLQALEPILRNLNRAGDDLPRASEMLLTFPFPDYALQAIKGDYLNLYLDVDTQTGKGGR